MPVQDIKEAIYTFLTSKALLTDLVATRIYPEAGYQGGSLPYVTYNQEDSDHVHHLTAASELADHFYTFKIHAATSESRNQIRDALRMLLHGRKNTSLAAATGGAVNLRSCWLIGTHESYEPPVDASETGGVFVCEMDFKLTFAESAPSLV